MVDWLEGQVPLFAFLAAVLATGFCGFLLIRSPRNPVTVLLIALSACLAEWNLFEWLGSQGTLSRSRAENLQCVGYSLAPAVLLHFAATVVGLGRMQAWTLRTGYAVAAVFGFIAVGGLLHPSLQGFFESEGFNEAWVATEGPLLAVGLGTLGVGAAAGPREVRGILRYVLAAGTVAGVMGILTMLRGAGEPGVRAASLGAALACVLLALAARRFPEVFDSYAILRDETEKVRGDYRRLVESMPAAFYSSRLSGDPPERVNLYVTPRIADDLGYEPSEWTSHGRLWEEKVPAEDRARVAEAVRAAARGGGHYAVEYRIAAKDGRVRWVRDTGTAAPAPDGGGVLLEGFAVDISEQKALEAEFHQAQKMEALGQLAAGVAHDFNNLLTVIEGYSELLASRLPPDDPGRPWAQEVQRAGRRAASLTRQLLAFSRKQPVRLEVLSPNDAVRGIEKMLRRLLPPTVELAIELDPGAGQVRADAGQIDQVLMNLTVNARDAMPSGGRLTIATGTEVLREGEPLPSPEARPGRYVRIAVADTGIGMDAATLARIFEPFFTTKGPGKGTGLGLSTVYGIIRQSGGFLRVESEPGRGATFRVCLPAAGAGSVSAADGTVAAAAPRGEGRILVAEDEAAILALVRDALAAHGYEVVVARDGEEALAAAGSAGTVLRAALLDIALPKVDGMRVALRLRERIPGLPCLFVTGSAEFVGVDASAAGPGIAVLQKPFTGPALLEALADLLARTAGAPRAPARPPAAIG